MPTQKAPAGEIDPGLVRELAEILNDTGLNEIEVEREGLKIRVTRQLAPPAAVYAASPAAPPAAPLVAATPAPAATPPPEPTRAAGDLVKSPMVGTVYLQPQPGSPPFAKVGDTVAEGQTLLLIEAMKTMNPITAPRAGKLVEYLVVDAQPVEYGEPLVILA